MSVFPTPPDASYNTTVAEAVVHLQGRCHNYENLWPLDKGANIIYSIVVYLTPASQRRLDNGFHRRVAGEDAGDGDRHVHGVPSGRGDVAADEAEGLGTRFAGNSPEISYEIFIMQMSRFGQIVPNVLDALCPTV